MKRPVLKRILLASYLLVAGLVVLSMPASTNLADGRPRGAEFQFPSPADRPLGSEFQFPADLLDGELGSPPPCPPLCEGQPTAPSAEPIS